MTEPKILIVQNENAPMLVLKKALAEAGFQVIACNGGFDALDEMRTEPAHLVVTSAGLPDLNGFQLSSTLKTHELTHNVPVVVVGTKDELADNFWKRLSLADLLLERKDIEFNEEKAVAKLKQLLKIVPANSRQPAADCPVIPADLSTGDLVRSYKGIVSSFLIERSVAHLSRVLVDSINSRVQFMANFFGYMKAVFCSELTGLFVADPQTPWAIYEVSTPVSKASFDKLQSGVNKIAAGDNVVRTIAHGETPEKGAAVKAHQIIEIRSSGNQLLGGVVLGWTAKHEADESESLVTELLRTSLRPVFRALLDLQQIQNLREHQQFGSFVDPLTGLYNLEFLVGFLQQQLLFSFRQKLPVGVILVDIDRFLELNQTHGTEAGDQVLIGVASKISRIIRSSDLLARYSGDIFAIVLPNTDSNGSKILGEKLRQEIESMKWDTADGKPLSVTISVGCAQFNMEDANPETVLRDAKVALMSAKEAGRNRVCVGSN